LEECTPPSPLAPSPLGSKQDPVDVVVGKSAHGLLGSLAVAPITVADRSLRVEIITHQQPPDKLGDCHQP
jgi:hypothetical protein